MKPKKQPSKPGKPRTGRTRQEIVKWLDQHAAEVLLADGLDDAFIGLDYGPEGEPRAVYSRDKCVEVLARSMTHEQAVEYFDYNVEGAYVGPQTPLYIDTI
jgi:hypothetical protein